MEPNDYVTSVILQACPPGKYYGKEAQSMLNKIALLAHSTILTSCKEYSEIGLLTSFYRLFDETCYYSIRGKYWSTEDAKLIRSFEVAPSAFGYLVNAVLLSKSESSKAPAKPELNSIAGLAVLLVQVCNYSDFLFYTGYNDGFEISGVGKLNIVQSEKTRALQSRVIEKMAERRLTVHSDKLWGKTRSFQELSEPYDNAFRQKYEIRLSEVSEIISHSVLYNVKEVTGAITSSYRDLVKRFRKGLKENKSTVERALNLFELDREMLSTNWRYFKVYDMRPSSSRQPIVRISGRVGKDGMVVFGPNALLRALSLLFADLDRGIVDLGEFSKKHLTEKGRKFEEKVKELFEKYDFETLHVTDTPGNVGEIDCMAYNDTCGTLFVIEAKSPKIDLSLREAGWQVKNTQKWFLQLSKKSDWVRSNLAEVARMLSTNPDNIKQIRDLVVVEVPTFCEIACSQKTVTIEDLYYMLESIRG